MTDGTEQGAESVKGSKVGYTTGDIIKALTERPYRFAKTMPKNPHHYTLREEWLDAPGLFDAAVKYIRKWGVKEMFKGREYTVFYLRGYRYWTMGNPVDRTKLINRNLDKNLDRDRKQD